MKDKIIIWAKKNKKELMIAILAFISWILLLLLISEHYKRINFQEKVYKIFQEEEVEELTQRLHFMSIVSKTYQK